MDLDTFEWLLTDPGQRLLELVSGPETGARERALRTSYDGQRIAAARTQVTLRGHARAKFGDLAARMYFTRDALAQATRLPVAEHRAARIAAAAPSSVIDLGCGIGGDLVALARAGLVVAGVDLDPLRVAIARANLAALGPGGAVSQADATTLDLAPFGVRFADPARRTGAGRSFRVEDWVPPWDFVTGLLTRPACVKVAPGVPHSLVPAGVEAEWVSDHGDLKEAALWGGPLATVSRRATVLGDGGLATLTDEDDTSDSVRAMGGFVYEPDDAVIRAGLVSAVAAGVGGGLLDPRIAYVTGDRAFRTPFARSFRVLEEVPYREKPLRAALRERKIGRLTIKKRGVQVSPEALRKRLGLQGDREATLLMSRTPAGARAWLVEPL